MNENNIELNQPDLIKQNGKQELNASLSSLLPIIKQEPNLTSLDRIGCDGHSIEIEKIKLECNLLVQTVLKRKRTEIKKLEDEKNQLIQNDKIHLNEINLLKSKIVEFEKCSTRLKTVGVNNMKAFITTDKYLKPRFQIKTESMINSESLTETVHPENMKINQYTNVTAKTTEASDSTGEKYHIFKLPICLNWNIWNSSKKFKKYIKKNEMNNFQKSEFNIVDKYINQIIFDNFGYKTSFSVIEREQHGYYMRRKCSLGCSGFNVKLNIHENTINLMINNQCPHAITRKKKKKTNNRETVIAKIKNSFSTEVWSGLKNGSILKNQMNESQRKETRKIDIIMCEKLSEMGINKNLSATSFCRTENGYTLVKKCTQSAKCTTQSYKFRVDLNDGTGLIYRYRKLQF